MTPHQRRLGFTLSLWGTLAPLALPLSGHPVAALSARPGLLALTVTGAACLAVAAALGSSRSILPGLFGAACGAVTTLSLLRDGGIAGSAASGFWAMTLAVWLGSALCVNELASMRPRGPLLRRALGLAVPLLFGAVVFYLWEAFVRGFGVSPVILPAPSAAAARFVASLPTLGADFVQTFIRGVLIGYVIGCGAGLLVGWNERAHKVEQLV